MDTRRSIAETIIKNIRQEQPDSNLSVKAVGRVVDNIRDKKVFEDWQLRYQTGSGGIDDGFLSTHSVATTYVSADKNHQGSLPAVPVGLPNNSGIRSVSYGSTRYDYLNQANITSLPSFLQKSFKSTYYYEGSDLYINGLSSSLASADVSVTMAAVSHTLGWDEDYPIPSRLVWEVVDEATQNYLRSLQVPISLTQNANPNQ